MLLLMNKNTGRNRKQRPMNTTFIGRFLNCKANLKNFTDTWKTDHA